MQRADRGRLAVVKAQDLGQTVSIMLSPFGHGAVTFVAAENGGARQGQDRGQGKAPALFSAEVGHFGQHFDERTTGLSHQATSSEKGCSQYSRFRPEN